MWKMIQHTTLGWHSYIHSPYNCAEPSLSLYFVIQPDLDSKHAVTNLEDK